MNMKKILLGILIILVVLIGIGSRLFKSNSVIVDKYLGDALYAIMFYLLLSFFSGKLEPWRKSLVILGFMLVIEAFQLTGIPLILDSSGNLILEIISILLGTEFGWIDILAYSLGILMIFVIDKAYIFHLEE